MDAETPGNGVLDVELPGAEAAQRREMAAATELLADVVAEGAHVGALRAGNGEPGVRDAEFVDPHRIDVHEARVAGDLLALAGHLVKGDAADLDRGNHRRDLEDVAGEIGTDDGFERLARDAGRIGAAGALALGVLRVGAGAEAEHALVDLVAAHHGLRSERGLADEDREKAGRLRIERAAVADLLELEHAADGHHDVARRDAGRLVHEKDPVGIGEGIDVEAHRLLLFRGRVLEIVVFGVPLEPAVVVGRGEALAPDRGAAESGGGAVGGREADAARMAEAPFRVLPSVERSTPDFSPVGVSENTTNRSGFLIWCWCVAPLVLETCVLNV